MAATDAYLQLGRASASGQSGFFFFEMNGRSSASQLRKERIVLSTGFSSAAKNWGRQRRKKDQQTLIQLQHETQLASLPFLKPFSFVQCLPWLLRHPATPIPGHCWRFFDFSPSKDSSMCKSPDHWKRLLSSFATLGTVSPHHVLKWAGSWSNCVRWLLRSKRKLLETYLINCCKVYYYLSHDRQ